MNSLFHVLKVTKPNLAGEDALRRLLQNSYDGLIEVGDWRPAPSEWWRNELEFLSSATAHRWVHRAHVFEAGPSDQPRYIGFANIRPKMGTPDEGDPLTADAFLAPPFRMLSGNYKIPAIRETSQIYGDHYFACLPYVQQQHGFQCAHACLYMAMLMTLDFDSRPLGPWDMTLWLKLAEKNQPPFDFKFGELEAKECIEILRHADCNLWAFDVTCGVKHHEPPIPDPNVREFLEQIRCYVEAGLPVILHVRASLLHHPSLREELVPEQDKTGHAVVIVGIGLSGAGDKTFVFHDPAIGPYQEIGFDRLASCLFEFKADATNTFVSAIAVVPQSVRYPLRSCLAVAVEEEGSVGWHADLIPRHHLRARLRRLLAAGLEPVAEEESPDLDRPLKHLLSNALPNYCWVLWRVPTTGSPIYARVVDATNSEFPTDGQPASDGLVAEVSRVWLNGNGQVQNHLHMSNRTLTAKRSPSGGLVVASDAKVAEAQ